MGTGSESVVGTGSESVVGGGLVMGAELVVGTGSVVGMGVARIVVVTCINTAFEDDGAMLGISICENDH